MNFTWALPGRSLTGAKGALLGGWNLAGIWTMRSGNPLTVFVTTNRSRSQWNPSRGPGIGQDRPDYAPGYGPDNAVLGRVDQWFDPAAFALQPAGTFGNTGRGDFTGPNLRTLDMALSKTAGWARLGGRLEFRVEAFNLLNRANFGAPELRAFSGTEGQPVLATFGRITNTDHLGAADSAGDQSGVLDGDVSRSNCRTPNGGDAARRVQKSRNSLVVTLRLRSSSDSALGVGSRQLGS